MNYCFILLSAVCLVLIHYGTRSTANPFKLFVKCLTDRECEYNHFCEHSGLNPFGTCTLGKEDHRSCVMDRYCQSKRCHLLKCVPKPKVKDGVCHAANHGMCIDEQYCSHLKDTNTFKCKNRMCEGWCNKDAHCMSNQCIFFRCTKSPNAVCKS